MEAKKGKRWDKKENRPYQFYKMGKVRTIFTSILKQKEWIHILASVATILSLCTAFHLFKVELNRQAEETRTERLAQLSSLSTEFSHCVKTIDQYLGLKGDKLTKIYFRRLPIENLKASVTRGWLMSDDLGPKLLLLYEEILEENLQLEIENSPEYVLTSPDNWLQRKKDGMETRKPRLEKIRRQILEVDGYVQSKIKQM